MIVILLDNVCTKHMEAEPHIEDDFVSASANLNIAKLAVVEKNRGTGRTAVGFVKGFRLPRGAIASSIAHDTHNYTCIGMDDASMAAALKILPIWAAASL